MSSNIYHAVGKRKTAVARVFLSEGEGKITVNRRDYHDYFPVKKWQEQVDEPFRKLELERKYNTLATVSGGGINAQSQALRHAISKALVVISNTHKSVLKKARFLTRDARVVERKKYGHKKARKSFQYSKR